MLYTWGNYFGYDQGNQWITGYPSCWRGNVPKNFDWQYQNQQFKPKLGQNTVELSMLFSVLPRFLSVK